MTPPSEIAHYKITSKLGEGGMGAVYRATDTKLNRGVAIKVLPPAFADDGPRMQRFEREAQLLASLNHPNIASIYGIEEGAIVMELVEGEDLKGPVPMGTAIAYARQIAAGLEAAHEKGIVHRDLKPANIKVTPDGVVKLLDFGLAKTTEHAQSEAHATISLSMTQGGMILGTVAYMSPEQARGKPVDRRADIWAFGVVLFEMLTGKALFATGDTVTDIIAAVVTREPDWSALPADTPPDIWRLLERCLRKDVKMRLQAIGEARIVLDEPSPVQAPVTAPLHRASIWAIPLVVAVAGAAWWTGSHSSRPVSVPLVRLKVDLGPGAVAGERFAAALAPDGSRMVFTIRAASGNDLLATRLLSEDKTTPLAGTEGGADPFFSPDSQWIGFFAGSKLKKIPVMGGAPLTLCDVASARGAAWSEDGSIVLTAGTTMGLSTVPDSGGKLEDLTDPSANKQGTHRWPQFLPGSRQILFTGNVTPINFDDAEIEVFDRKTRQVKTVLRGGFFGRYLPSGQLVFVHKDTLYAVRFDLSRLETSGTPVAILKDVSTSLRGGSGEFDAAAGPSGAGIFVYLSGSPHDVPTPVVWVDAAGNTQPLLPTPGFYAWPRLSKDGRFLAVSGAGTEIHLWDAQRGTLTQLTYTSQLNRYPIWAADGKHLAFASHNNKVDTIWWIRTDGGGQPVKLLESPEQVMPSSMAPDGSRLAYYQTGPGTGGDLWTLPLDLTDPDRPKPGKPEVFLQTPKVELTPQFSPDGRWMAYTSDDTGQQEVYVRPFPGPGGMWKVSSGGSTPRWAPASHQLFYATNDSRLMVLDYETRGDTFLAGKPRPFAPNRVLISSGYDVAPDGKRIAAPVTDVSELPGANLQVTFLLNFFDELKREGAVTGALPSRRVLLSLTTSVPSLYNGQARA